MIKVSKCCVIFPLRPGCVAIGIVITVLSLMGAINKLIEICLFSRTLRGQQTLESYDTRLVHSMQAGIIRFSVVMLVELIICGSGVAFIYGIVKERLRLMAPFIAHLSLKVGYFAVHYFDVGTTHIEKSDTTGGLRLYTFGIIICCTFGYLWLCAYSTLMEMKAEKDVRKTIRNGILQSQQQAVL